MSIFDNKAIITNVYSRDYNDASDYSRKDFEVCDEISVAGSNLHVPDLSDPEQGLFLNGAQGSIKCVDVSENKEKSFIAEIPEYLQTGDYMLEFVVKDEDGCPRSTVYSKIHIKGFTESYGISKTDLWYNRGLKAGRTELADKLVAWLEENDYRKPEFRLIKQKSQKKVVVVRK